MFKPKMIPGRLPAGPLPAMKVTPAPSDKVPPALPTRPTLHASMVPKKPLGAEDPSILEQSLLRRMKNNY